MGSTAYRFVRYYTHDEPYLRRGLPPTVLRFLAPGVVLTTLALFGTGIALYFALTVEPPGWLGPSLTTVGVATLLLLRGRPVAARCSA